MKTPIEMFREEFAKLKEKNWDCIYVLVDFHGTCCAKTYSNEIRLYSWAMNALALMSQNPYIKLIAWTSTSDKFISDYIKKIEENHVKFYAVNCNPDVKNDELSCYDKKPYFNICLDDKCGFEPCEWFTLYMYFRDDKNFKDLGVKS